MQQIDANNSQDRCDMGASVSNICFDDTGLCEHWIAAEELDGQVAQEHAVGILLYTHPDYVAGEVKTI